MKNLIEATKNVLLSEAPIKLGYTIKIERKGPETMSSVKTILSDDEQSVEISGDGQTQWSTIFGLGKKLGLWTSKSRDSAPATLSLKLVGGKTEFKKLISALQKTKLNVKVKK